MWYQLEKKDYNITLEYLNKYSPFTCPMYGNVLSAGFDYKPFAMRSGVFFIYKETNNEILGIVAGFNDGNVMVHLSSENSEIGVLEIIKRFPFHSVWGLGGNIPDNKVISDEVGKSFDSRELDVMVLKEDIQQRFHPECGILRIDKKFLLTVYINFIKKCLWEGFGFRSNSRDLRKRMRERTDLEPYWILSADNKFVAQAHLQAMTPLHGYIGGICTPREYRRKGYAKEVVARACRYVFKQGRVPALSVSASNTAAHKLYEDLGFEKVGIMTVYMVERDFKGDENS